MVINYRKPSETPASIGSGTLAGAAESRMLRLLDAMRNREVGHGGAETCRVKTFYLELGGPDTRVTFTLDDDGDPTGGVLIYTDSQGASAAPVPEAYVTSLYAALNAYSD